MSAPPTAIPRDARICTAPRTYSAQPVACAIAVPLANASNPSPKSAATARTWPSDRPDAATTVPKSIAHGSTNPSL